MNEKKALLCLVSVVVIMITVLSSTLESINSERQNIATILQDESNAPGTKSTVTLQVTLNQPGSANLMLSIKQTPLELHRPVVRVRYTLALSYFDQISNAAHRLQSHQCWASKMASKIVEPFVVDNTYLGARAYQ